MGKNCMLELEADYGKGVKIWGVSIFCIFMLILIIVSFIFSKTYVGIIIFLPFIFLFLWLLKPVPQDERIYKSLTIDENGIMLEKVNSTHKATWNQVKKIAEVTPWKAPAFIRIDLVKGEICIPFQLFRRRHIIRKVITYYSEYNNIPFER